MKSSFFKSSLFLMALVGAVIPPLIPNIPLHHLMTFFPILTLFLLDILGGIRKKEFILFAIFVLIPFAADMQSGYLFSSLSAFKELPLFIWTAIVWLTFYRHSDYWSWKKLTAMIVIADVFVFYHVLSASYSSEKYISTVESSYIYLVLIASLILYRYSPVERNIRLFLTAGNLILSAYVMFLLSTSRGALLGLLAGLAGISLILTIMFLGALVFLPILFETPVNYSERLVEGVAQIGSNSGTAAERYILWQKILDSASHNFIGTGPGSYKTLINDRYIEVAESMYMEVMSAGGWFLFFLFLYVSFLLLKSVREAGIEVMALMTVPFVMMATNPIGYHPVIPMYISLIIWLSRVVVNQNKRC